MRNNSQKDLLYKIYDELDIIYAISRMTRLTLGTHREELGAWEIILIFKEIEARYSKIFELLEQLEDKFCCSAT